MTTLPLHILQSRGRRLRGYVTCAVDVAVRQLSITVIHQTTNVHVAKRMLVTELKVVTGDVLNITFRDASLLHLGLANEADRKVLAFL